MGECIFLLPDPAGADTMLHLCNSTFSSLLALTDQRHTHMHVPTGNTSAPSPSPRCSSPPASSSPACPPLAPTP